MVVATLVWGIELSSAEGAWSAGLFGLELPSVAGPAEVARLAIILAMYHLVFVTIGGVGLLEKSGGKSGHWRRDDPNPD